MPHQHDHPGSRGHSEPGLLSVDFANSVACPSCRVADALSSADEFNRWVRARPIRPVRIAGSSEMRTLRRFRRDIRALLGACVSRTLPSAASLERVNSARRRASGHSELMWHDGRWMIMDRKTSDSAAEAVTGAVAQSVADLLASSDRLKLRACRGPGCNHFLLARNRHQIWCSPTGCGNRVRVARHYRKVHRESSSSRALNAKHGS